MATAGISFNDGSGVQTLTPSPRFSILNKWRPIPTYTGEKAWGLGDRRGYQYIHATMQRASFELPCSPMTDEAILRAFQLWANGQGTFTVSTGDSEANEYADCQLAPDTEVDVSEPDAATLEYTLSMTVIHVGTPQQTLRAVYTGLDAVVDTATTAPAYVTTVPDADETIA